MRHRAPDRPGENPRPPRYRLLAAAAALPQREPERPTQTYEGACPACGRDVQFTQVEADARMDYVIAEHDCR